MFLKEIPEVNWLNRDIRYSYRSSAAGRTKGKMLAFAAGLALGRSPSTHSVSRNQDLMQFCPVYYSNSIPFANLSMQ